MKQGRVVVGDEMRHLKERKTFVEQLFNPNSSMIGEPSTQKLKQYETKLASTAPLSKENSFNSDSTKNGAKPKGTTGKEVLV